MKPMIGCIQESILPFPVERSHEDIAILHVISRFELRILFSLNSKQLIQINEKFFNCRP